MDISLLVLLFGLSIFVGVSIGAVGIGGILLVPMLTFIFGINVHVAIAAAMFSYLFSGVVGAAMYAREKSINWRMAGWLILGATPAAFAGAVLTLAIPGETLKLIIAFFIMASGVNALINRARADRESAFEGAKSLVPIGVVTGVGSAMTGTGGPFVLIPIMVWLRVPVLTAVGLSQVVQLPIAALATAGNVMYGELDFLLGLVIAGALMIGAAIGARIAHALPQAVLKRVVAWVLVGVGIFIVVRIVGPF